MATRALFLANIRGSMGITTVQLPDASTDIDAALNLALALVYAPMQNASQLIYDSAVYNLGGSNLIEFASDQTGQTFFADMRKKFNINGFVPGAIQSASDEGTSESMLIPDFMKNLTMADLQYIKTPWGRTYLSYAQRIGPMWGIS